MDEPAKSSAPAAAASTARPPSGDGRAKTSLFSSSGKFIPLPGTSANDPMETRRTGSSPGEENPHHHHHHTTTTTKFRSSRTPPPPPPPPPTTLMDPPPLVAGPDAMVELETAFRSGVHLRDRRSFFYTYKNSFTGSNAVDWLIATNRASSREDAVKIGQAMVDSGIFEHVRRDYPFLDSDAIYHFVDEQERGSSARNSNGLPVRWADFLDPTSMNHPNDPAFSEFSSLLPRIPSIDFDTIPHDSFYVTTALRPLDEHNLRLMDNVHPPGWKDPKYADTYNLVVVGAGPGGLVAAAGAAGVGAKVALIEAHSMGGDCLNTGCIPSKALLYAANLAHSVRNVRHLEEVGISVQGGAEAVKVDFAKVMQRLRKVRADISKNDSAQRFTKKLGVDVYFGFAKFSSEKTVIVNGKTLEFRRAIIATGGHPGLIQMSGLETLYRMSLGPKDPGRNRPAILTTDTFFNLTEFPERLGVIGSGVGGMELAQAMQRLGSKVSVFARSGTVLPREDRDLADIVKEQLSVDGVQFHMDISEFTSIQLNEAVTKNGFIELVMRMETKAKARLEYRCDALLLAVGRKPNVRGMDLELANIKYDEVNGLVVNDYLQTTNPRVYGVGECCTDLKYTHAANFMARMVVRNALFFGKERRSALVIPYCTYTSPEIAHVGLYARDLKERNIEFRTIQRCFADNDRCITDSCTAGLIRVHVEQKSDRILGASIVGKEAGNLIGEITLAMQSGTGLGKLGGLIHPYPTHAETIGHVGDEFNRGRLTPTVRGLLRSIVKLQ